MRNVSCNRGCPGADIRTTSSVVDWAEYRHHALKVPSRSSAAGGAVSESSHGDAAHGATRAPRSRPDALAPPPRSGAPSPPNATSIQTVHAGGGSRSTESRASHGRLGKSDDALDTVRASSANASTSTALRSVAAPQRPADVDRPMQKGARRSTGGGTYVWPRRRPGRGSGLAALAGVRSGREQVRRRGPEPPRGPAIARRRVRLRGSERPTPHARPQPRRKSGLASPVPQVRCVR